MFFEEKQEYSLKDNWKLYVVFSIVIIIAIMISYTVGKNAKIKAEAISAVTQKIADSNKELQKLKDDISVQDSVLKELENYLANKSQKNAEIEQLDAQISEKSAKNSTLDSDISAKSAELERLTNAVVKTGEAPRTLPAGNYTVGTDLTPGRYSVTGRSNFIAYSASGSLKVNTILGSGNFANESYTCTLNSGDILELHSQCTFTPIR